MTCSETRDRLLQTATPEELPPTAGEHLLACDDCRRLAADVERLERTWRDLPLPASADTVREAFLQGLADRPMPAPKPARRLILPRWAVAAAVLLTAGMAGWLVLPSGEARASADVLDRLIDWNLDLADADLPDRARLGERAAAFDLGHVPAADRDLAEALLQNGTWLAANDDPLGVAERFDMVADHLLARIQKAADAGERKRSDRLSRQYRRVLERGIAPNVRRALASPALDFEHQRQVERVILSDEGRLEKLAALLDRAPDASRKEIRKALEVSKKRPKPPKRERPAGRRPPAADAALTPPADGR